jgi:hypothetical protein
MVEPDEVVTRNVDIDDDGVKEEVRRIDDPGYLMLYVMENDGTIFKTEFDSEGNIKYRRKVVPVPGEEHSYIYYIWDDTFEKWVLDLNQSRIPET